MGLAKSNRVRKTPNNQDKTMAPAPNTRDGRAIKLYRTHAADPPENAWKQFSTLFDLTPLRMPGNTGMIENQTWIAGKIIFAEVALDGNVHQHDERHLKNSGELLFVHRYLAGGADGLSVTTPYMMRPEMMIFHDYGSPFDGIQTPSRLQSLHVPHTLVGYDPGQMPPQVIFDAISEHGQILHQEFDAIFARLSQGAETLEAARVERLLNKIRSAMPRGSESSPSDTDTAKPGRAALQKHIESQLGNPELSRDSLVQDFETSRRHLFEQFEIFGGVTTYIEVRRLFQALFALWKSPKRSDAIPRLARTWGFDSTEAFIHAARTHYDADPYTIFSD